MNTEWALGQLNEFLGLTEMYRPADPPGMTIIALELCRWWDLPDVVASAQALSRSLIGF